MNRINWFGFIFISPVLIMVLLFFLTPVVMTAFFSFTNMSTSTGIKGGEYLINQETIKEIKKYNIQKDTIEKLENAEIFVQNIFRFLKYFETLGIFQNVGKIFSNR